jgi:VanZ family protein
LSQRLEIKDNSRTRLLWTGATLGIAAAIFVQSSLPSLTIPGWAVELIFGEAQAQSGEEANDLAHAVAHLCLYGALAFCIERAIGAQSLRGAGVATAIAFLYGISDEWHQSMIAAREASTFDLGLDLIGAVVGSGSALRLARLWS